MESKVNISVVRDGNQGFMSYSTRRELSAPAISKNTGNGIPMLSVKSSTIRNKLCPGSLYARNLISYGSMKL